MRYPGYHKLLLPCSDFVIPRFCRHVSRAIRRLPLQSPPQRDYRLPSASLHGNVEFRMPWA